jgi:methionine aminopeptidase
MRRRLLALVVASVAVVVTLAPAATAGPEIVKRELIHESARISDIGQAAAQGALARAFNESVTEADVIDALSQAMISAGSSQYVDGFAAIVASGTASSIPHGDPSDDADNFILPGEVVVVDIGARYKGWVSDNTKTYFIGNDPPEEFVKVYNIVFEAQRRGYEAIASLMVAGDLDSVARSYIEEQGYGENFTHCLGHGMGLYVHVPPLICPGSTDVLLASRNDVVAIEPGIYLENCFGVRIEDDFAVLRSGYERYTFAPSEFGAILIDPPEGWNGTSPTGEFANYTGCPFAVDPRAAAGAPPPHAVVASGADAAGAVLVAVLAAAVAVVVLHRVGRLPLPASVLAVPARVTRMARGVPTALRRLRN